MVQIYFRFLFCCLFLLSTGTSIVYSDTGLLTIDEKSLTSDGIIYQRGAFRFNDDGSISSLCIKSYGKWVEVGSQKDCGDSPEQKKRIELERFEEDKTYLAIRNLGIDNEDLVTDSSKQKATQFKTLLNTVKNSCNVNITNEFVSWNFNSKNLPEKLRADIPGAAIHTHFGEILPVGKRFAIVEAPGGDLDIEVRLAVPEMAISGRAHTGITLAVDLEVKTADNSSMIMPLIVRILHPQAKEKETIRSDGRSIYASTYLGSDTKYIKLISGKLHTQQWKDLETIKFKISKANLRTVMDDASSSSLYGHRVDFKKVDVNQIRLAGISLRNEQRFLDKGDVKIRVLVDYIKTEKK